MARKLSSVDLPPEIISEIFIRCLPWISRQAGRYPFQNIEPPIVFDPRDAPFLLMHICRRWRLIAEATPTLWTRLPTTRSSEAPELFEMYVKNSRNAPMWTHFASGGAGREVANILIPHSYRWEHLTLTFRNSDDPANIVTPNLPNQLPLLKHLNLQQHDGPFRGGADPYRLPELIAPLLRSVSIFASKVLGLNLPWSQLTHYWGEFDRLVDARACLSLCTNLEVLYLQNPSQDRSSRRTLPSPIHLPRLRDLILANDYDYRNSYHRLVDSLILPVLETFSIGLDEDYPVLRGLCQCIARSSLGGVPHLRSVEIEFSQILTQFDLQELSLAAPGIEELRISQLSPEALSAMAFHPTDPPLFPNLQHLALFGPLLTGYELVDVITSRCRPPSSLDSHIRLRCVEVMFKPAPSMVQPLHEKFQDVAECFTDDPSFQQMCEELRSILIVREISPGTQEYELPSHWGKSMDVCDFAGGFLPYIYLGQPLQCFFEFSDAIFTFLENYWVYHPLLLSRHRAAPLLREFMHGNLGSGGLLGTHRPEFLSRAGALLDKWQPLIDEYSEKERWVIETVDKTDLLARWLRSTHKAVYCTSG